MKIKGIPFMELVELLSQYGFNNLQSLERMEPNPLKWTPQQWRFAIALISKSTNLSAKALKEQLRTPRQILVAFNESLRKTGLLIELQQIKKISELDVQFPKTHPAWEEEWVNE